VSLYIQRLETAIPGVAGNRCFCLLGSIPNPLENPLTTYNTAQGSFDGVLREIFQKSFPYALLRGSLGNANVSEENF